MKQSLNELIGYSIETKDGLKGTVKDFLFDEENWIIRYVVADLGFVFPGKEVLIPQSFLQQPDWTNRHFPIELEKKDLEKCPPLESAPTISRVYEEKLNQYFNIQNYWMVPYAQPLSKSAIIFPPRPLSVPRIGLNEKNIKSQIRSFKEVKGYQIEAIDGKIGHVEDILIDDLDWQIVYSVIDTKNFIPWSKKVLVGTNWMEEISYLNKKVKIKQDKETINLAPKFGSSEPITFEYENLLFNYYENSAVEH